MADEPDYGIDAPGLVRGFFFAGGIGSALVASVVMLIGLAHAWQWILLALVVVGSAYALGLGHLMLYCSKFYKIRNRERLLDTIQWTGSETALDVGCGSGLMLIGVANRTPSGRSIGIDLWAAKDQSRNRQETTVENARRERVSDRVEVKTGDMRNLPFDDASFDVIVSHWAVHNVPSEADRRLALGEMTRVLKLGGQVLIADITNQDGYATAMRDLGLIDIRRIGPGCVERIYGLMSFGRFRPSAVFARKADRVD